MTSSTRPSEVCPRCGGGFRCGAREAQCDCFDLKLTDALRSELAAQYPGCLCLDCLRALQGAEASSRPGGLQAL